MAGRARTDSGASWRARHTTDGLPAACSDLVRTGTGSGDLGARERIASGRCP
ncbi:hypothetical protein ACFWWC_04010 [Streptomyces sp. NPDC058642]|uniref:hypothetical protein n=1 Tax=Streptomyces sp. NPDC058642 TaxID=3346572 RepID=UPI0036617CD0